MIKVKVNNQKGYVLLAEGGIADLSYQTSTTRRGRVIEMGNISPTICAGEYDLCRVENLYRIRKLTPRECWRLMGFCDSDFDKAQSVCSDSQLYKQAGNSICKPVLSAIFKNLVFGSSEPDEEIDLFNWNKQDYTINKPIRLIELFAGIGAQAMGLRDCGAEFEHYKVVEFDKFAIQSYNAIHGTNFEPMDITKIGGGILEIKETNKYEYIMCYSFPCQSLSVAGKQDGMEKGSGTTSSLLWEVERLLNEVENLPQVLLMENVTQVHSKRNEKAFENWKSFLESKGYKNFVCDLNASEVGYPNPIPQSRKRCFMVSILGDCKYTFPGATELTTEVIDYLEPEVDEKYYLSGDKVDRLLHTLLSKYELDNESLCVDDVASKQASKQAIDLTINEPGIITTANCICARNDRGISNLKQEGTGILEFKADRQGKLQNSANIVC